MDYESTNIPAAAYLAREADPADNPREDAGPDDAVLDERRASTSVSVPDFFERARLDPIDRPF